MNDLMSFGAHRLWKRFALSLTGLKPGQHALDVAGGTGDLARGLLRQVGKEGRVVLSDVNPRMLEVGRDRLLDEGFVANLQCIVADAERLPFRDDSFDCVTIGFGLRNVTDKAAALAAMHRVLKPGGQLLVLEFSAPVAPGLKPLYDAYSFGVLPMLGRLVAPPTPSAPEHPCPACRSGTETSACGRDRGCWNGRKQTSQLLHIGIRRPVVCGRAVRGR